MLYIWCRKSKRSASAIVMHHCQDPIEYCLQELSKMLGQNSGMSFPHQNWGKCSANCWLVVSQMRQHLEEMASQICTVNISRQRIIDMVQSIRHQQQFRVNIGQYCGWLSGRSTCFATILYMPCLQGFPLKWCSTTAGKCVFMHDGAVVHYSQLLWAVVMNT